MDFLDKELTEYAVAHTTPETDILKEINRETNAKILYPQMLAGHLQGQVLTMFSQMIKPKQILEIGTYTGYSAICLAKGLVKGGMLHTIEINNELEEMIKQYFKKCGLDDRIKLHIGNAIDIIPEITHPLSKLDLVYIDADKINYKNYFDLVFDKVSSDGIIIADNALWSGKVLAKHGEKIDEDTQAIINFNNEVQNDPRVENVLLPVRDGLMIIRKK
ncbi:MAG: O-methyltransferase [Cytophagales bacterium]|nr:O-methyltransferase [Cytophagales bacterium]